MVRVKLACNWFTNKLYTLSDRIEKEYITRDNFDPDIQFTESDNYDYLVIFNDFIENSKINVDKKYILGFILDPPFHTRYYNINLGEYCQKVYTCSDKKYYINNENFISAPSVMFNAMVENAHIFSSNRNFTKPKKLSFCVSSRKGNSMYDFRRELVYKILESDLECDIYGRGWKISDPRFKGSPDNKSLTLLPYEYSIAIENSMYDGYVSEKLFDCFLCNTVPIYHGCPTIDSIYNPDSFYKLPVTNDFKDLIDWLRELTKLPARSNFKFRYTILESKERYFRDYNIYNFFKSFIKGDT